jgi:hypothetical protein
MQLPPAPPKKGREKKAKNCQPKRNWLHPPPTPCRRSTALVKLPQSRQFHHLTQLLGPRSPEDSWGGVVGWVMGMAAAASTTHALPQVHCCRALAPGPIIETEMKVAAPTSCRRSTASVWLPQSRYWPLVASRWRRLRVSKSSSSWAVAAKGATCEAAVGFALRRLLTLRKTRKQNHPWSNSLRRLL